ncbi:circadian clock protein KaiB [Sphingobacteriaceae bacterium]|nr:circadian clock protein KaiB [Sphingobacteriaceae bacterium]
MEDSEYRLILFISGMSVKSSHAIENLQKICEEYPAKKIKFEIIDIREASDKAEEYQIFAIPTLIKISPLPTRTVLGDLSDKEKVLKILELE